MFPKSLTVLKISNPDCLTKLTDDDLESDPCTPILPSAALSTGWVPARDDLYMWTYQGHSILNFQIEKKSVPASAIKRALKAVCLEVEKAEGFAPGGKRRKELKQQVKESLLARAIPSTSNVRVWIDRTLGRVLIENTSNATVTAIMSSLYGVCEMELEALPWPGSATLTTWLQYDDGEALIPAGLTADDVIEFDCPGEAGKVVKMTNADLSDEDVSDYIAAGAVVQKLAVTWDSQVSFMLGKSSELTKLKALGIGKVNDKDPDSFQNTMYLAATTTQNLINYLTERA